MLTKQVRVSLESARNERCVYGWLTLIVIDHLSHQRSFRERSCFSNRESRTEVREIGAMALRSLTFGISVRLVRSL